MCVFDLWIPRVVTAPNTTPRLHGHAPQQRAFLDAFESGRIPHAWLLAGPEGIGKATFAHLAARAILSETPNFEHDSNIAADQRISEGNEPALTILTRSLNEKTGKLRSNIAVEEVRALKRALTFAPTEGGWRVVIVDPAEDMNPSAANALLKVLEEPPAKVVFFLITHAPRRLLPTILSRCRRLDFSALERTDLATAYEDATSEPPSETIVAAARGSVGAALALAAQDGTALQDAIHAVLAPLPSHIDRAALHTLADTAAASGKDDAFRTTTKLIVDLTARIATSASGVDAPPSGYEQLVTTANSQSAPHWAEITVNNSALAERTLPDFEETRDDVVARAVANGVTRMVTICTRPSQEPTIRAIAEKYEPVYYAAGAHPLNVGEESVTTVEALVKMTEHPKMVGIGETGLDYHYDKWPPDLQKQSFRLHIDAARETGLPLIIHSRNADDDMAAMLREGYDNGAYPCVMHCFSSTRALAETALDMGFYLSMSGVVTFKNALELRDIFKDAPLDKILVETDAPYLAPVPKRGKRNEPAYVAHTAAMGAEIFGLSTEDFATKTTDNFHTLFSKVPRAEARS